MITLGIIGVVAAMTIPTLMQNFQDYQYKQMWKKDYSVISQAYLNIKQENGGDLTDFFGINANTSTQAPLLQQMANYIYVIKNCGMYYHNVCGTNPLVTLDGVNESVYKTLSGKYVNPNNLYAVQYVLKDGANFYSRAWGSETKILIFIDVNGYAKGPNTLGKDLFGAIATKNKVSPMGATGLGAENTCNSTSSTCYLLQNCSANFDEAGAGCSMEYLYQ